MALAFVDEYIVGKIKVNLKPRGGLVATVPLATSTVADGKTKLNELCVAWAAILALDAEIVQAVCSKKTVKGDRYPVIPTAVKGFNLDAEVAVPGPCNMPNDGLLYQFNTLEGKKKSILFRLIRDSWITNLTNQVANVTFFNGPFVPGAAVVAGATSTQALSRFLKVYANNTIFYRPLTAAEKLANPGKLWEPIPYQRIQLIKCGNRDFGKGTTFGRGRRKKRV